MRAPCMDCQNRHPGCHGQCEAYKAFRAKRDAIIAERQKAAIVLDYVIKNEERISRRKHVLRRK